MQIMKRSGSIKAKGMRKNTYIPLITMQKDILILKTNTRTLLFTLTLMKAKMRQSILLPETTQVPEDAQVSEAVLVSEGVPGRGTKQG